MRRRGLYIAAALVFAVGVLSFTGSGWAQDVKGHGEEPGGFTSRGGYCLGDGGRVSGVFHARRLCDARVGALPGQEHRSPFSIRIFGVVAVSSLAFWILGFALMFGRWQLYIGNERVFHLGG